MSRHHNPQAGKQPPPLTSGQNGHKDRDGGQDKQPPAFTRIEFVGLFIHTRVEGHYPGYDIIFDGRKPVKKIPNKDDNVEPTDSELAKFVQDLQVVAASDRRVAEFLQAYREYAQGK